MPESDRTEAYIAMLNRLMAEALGRGSANGGRTYLPNGRFLTLPEGRNPYNYFIDRLSQRMFCWTVVADNEGDYWTFVYAPVGTGSRTRRARRWKLRDLSRARKRKTAKDRAYRRLQAYQRKRLRAA